MEDLIDWFKAALDDEERVAQAKRPTYDDVEDSATAEDLFNAQMHTHACGYRMGCFGEDCCCGSPARVLAEIDAKRRIIDEHPALANGACDRCSDGMWSSGHQVHPCMTMRLLAQPYAHRPGFREEWRP
jgi:hypothetical protein